MDVGTAVAIVGSAFAGAATVIGVVRSVKGVDSANTDWHEPLSRVEAHAKEEVADLRELIHAVELRLSEIRHVTASLHEIRDLISKLERREEQDINRLEGKLDTLTATVLASLRQSA